MLARKIATKVMGGLPAVSKATAFESIEADIVILRNRLAEISQEVSAISAAPVDQAEAEARIDAAIAELQSSFRSHGVPDFSSRIAPETRGLGSSVKVLKVTGGLALSQPNTPTALELMAIADPGRLKSLWLNEYTDNVEGRDTYSEEDRQQRISELRAEHRALELTEERLLRDAEAKGFSVERRDDVSVELLLAHDGELA